MLSRFWRVAVFGVLAGPLMAIPGYGQGNSQGKGKGHQKHQEEDEDNNRDKQDDRGKHGKGRQERESRERGRQPERREQARTVRPNTRTRVSVIFSTRDRDVVTRYYSRNDANLPPGLAKRGGNLPPGLERQLQRNGRLPPGLEKRMEPCPRDLDRNLGPLPEGHRRVIIGAKLLILNERTNVIIDVMQLRR